MAHILAVGVAALDIINTVQDYPREDDELRAMNQTWQLGGNAANTLNVLRQLGHDCTWAGTLVENAGGRWIADQLRECCIELGACQWHAAGTVPTSCIMRNNRNGSRTILHYRDLEELQAKALESVDIAAFDWVHFEGRNMHEVLAMLEWIKARAPDLPCSVEIEKPRPDIEQLFPFADVLMFSRAYARAKCFDAGKDLLQYVSERVPQADLYCAWGDRGAYALTRAGEPLWSAAYAPGTVVDTLAAGDTFNAALIHGSLQGHEYQRRLDDACRLAGYKCGQVGLHGLEGVI